MRISLVNDLKIRDAGTDRIVSPILDSLRITDNNIVLDFCDCGVDYPATSRIIDKVLFDLSSMVGQKSLTILFDFKINEFALHKWFFVGSVFFNIKEDDRGLTNEKFKELLHNKLIQCLIVLEIHIVKKGEINKILQYGAK